MISWPASEETLFAKEVPMSFNIPKPLKIEHDHLHDDLRRAVAKGGRTGEAARVVGARLHPHFVAEEEFAMPPLGLLSSLAQTADGHWVSAEDAARAAAMADRLASEMPRMLAEHQEIVSALRSLIAAAREEGHNDVVEFAEKLMLHAQTEEEVLYPAAILVGRYLQLTANARSEPKAPA
jgi:hypothetical protein